MPRKGYKQTEERKKKAGLAISKALKGRILTEEWKQKISKSKKGYIVTEETKKKISKTMKGKSITERHKRNIGKSKEKLYSNPKNHPNYKDGRSLVKHYCIDCGKELSYYTHKRCVSCNSKLLWQNFEYKEKTIKAMNTLEYKENHSRRCKKQWKGGKMDGVFISPTKPEKRIMQILKNLKVDYIFQYRPKDFSMIYDLYISIFNLLIEFDGIYWHSLEEVKRKDKEKTQYAKDNNYNLLRMNEYDLYIFQDIILKLKKGYLEEDAENLERDSILDLLLKIKNKK